MTHIWVPRAKILEAEYAPPMSRISGQYTIKKYKVGFKEPVQVVGPFDNLITDWGLSKIASGQVNSADIYVGSGTAIPSVADTQLATFVARTNTDHGTVPTAHDPLNVDCWSQTTFTKRFQAGAATGTLTEVGFGDNGAITSPPTYNLFSRALIVDSSGNPVSITVLADEYLDVSYTLRVYPDTTDNTSIISISGTTHTLVSRLIEVPAGVQVNLTSIRARNGFSGQSKPPTPNAYSGSALAAPSLAPITASNMINQGTLATSGVTVGDPSYPASNTVEVPWTFGLNSGNATWGIRGIRTTNTYNGLRSSTQATVTPAIMKDSTKILSFGFKYSYGRH